MPKVEGYTDEQIFEVVFPMPRLCTRGLFLWQTLLLLAEAQDKVLEVLASPGTTTAPHDESP